MQTNYLSNHIDNLFGECTLLSANLYVTNSFLKERVKQLKTAFPFKGYELISMGSSFRDLSQLEGGVNLFATNKNYSLLTDDLEFETDRILSYHSCISVSQAFEVFESFLKDILTEVIINNHEIATVLKLKIETFELKEIRSSLKTIQGRNNNGFIKTIRKLSYFFQCHESNNIWGVNMTDWYKLIALIRHIIVHQRQKYLKIFCLL